MPWAKCSPSSRPLCWQPSELFPAVWQPGITEQKCCAKKKTNFTNTHIKALCKNLQGYTFFHNLLPRKIIYHPLRNEEETKCQTILLATSSILHQKIDCSPLVSDLTEGSCFTNYKTDSQTTSPFKEHSVYSSVLQAHAFCGGEWREVQGRKTTAWLLEGWTLRQCLFFCFIDGVNTVTVPGPASEEAVEDCKDEGMRPLTTSNDCRLLDYLGLFMRQQVKYN